jgi:hypothetical protein
MRGFLFARVRKLFVTWESATGGDYPGCLGLIIHSFEDRRRCIACDEDRE